MISALEGDSPDYNLVEVFEIELKVTPTQPREATSTDTFSVVGNKTDTSVNVSLSVECQAEFHGPRCDCQE